MNVFLKVTVDPEWPVGSVEYRPFSMAQYGGARVLRRDARGRVAACSLREHPYIESGAIIRETLDNEIIDIEILNVDDRRMVALARDYARDNGLEFPGDLRAAAKVHA
jgi:hypothetical protein